jgi:hypothetical protein
VFDYDSRIALPFSPIRLKHHVYCAAFAPDGEFVAFGHEEGQVRQAVACVRVCMRRVWMDASRWGVCAPSYHTHLSSRQHINVGSLFSEKYFLYICVYVYMYV